MAVAAAWFCLIDRSGGRVVVANRNGGRSQFVFLYCPLSWRHTKAAENHTHLLVQMSVIWTVMGTYR